MFKRTLVFFAKGFAMGSADLVPGISGATIALVLGVYQSFIRSVKRILSIEFLKLLLERCWREAAHYIRLDFILPLVAGLFTCIFTFASLIAYLLDNHPIFFWSFFFGLVLASAFVLPDTKEGFHPRKIFLATLGVITGYVLISLNAFHTPDTLPMFFLAGMIAIGAMLLPGISGSFMLVLIGKYTAFIHAIKDLDLQILITFALGALISLILLPRLIELILKSGKETFIIFISGFLIGSLKKIWPWRLTEPVTGLETAVSPFYYQEILSQDPQLLPAILFAILGISAILLLRYLEKKFTKVSDVS